MLIIQELKPALNSGKLTPPALSHLHNQKEKKQNVYFVVFTHLYSNHEQTAFCLNNDFTINETSDSFSFDFCTKIVQ